MNLLFKTNISDPLLMIVIHFLLKKDVHPVVEYFQRENFIPNSANITDEEKIWLITGPNMAGKSTFLRQNALICILVQIGSLCTCKKSSYRSC